MRAEVSGSEDQWTWRPSGRRVYQEDDLEVRNLRRRVRDFSKLTAARGYLSVDQISGFSSREAEEHVCCVGFDRRRLDVHRSDRERHGLLGLEDLDTAVSHGGCEMLWSLDPADKYV